MEPLVSIGVPLYNEKEFLEKSLRSLLAQTYTNLEIIISDNASADDTEAICRAFAAEDRRIAYHRQDTNHGAADNFRLVLSLAKGRYFMWASGHDLWSENLVADCVQALEAQPSAVLAFGSSRWIGPADEVVPKFYGWTDTRGMDAVGRFYSVFWGNMHPILGVIRVESLQRTRGVLDMVGPDLVLLSELALQGDFVHAVGASWTRREFRETENFKQRMDRYRSTQYGLLRSGVGRFFPLLRLPLELIRSVLRSKISCLEKTGILLTLLPALPVRYLVARKRQG